MLKRYMKNLISLVICVCVFAGVFAVCGITAYAIAYPCKGVVEPMKSEPDVWSLPGTSGHEIAENKNKSKLIEYIKVGDEVKITGHEWDGDGDLWYKIDYGSGYLKTGYIFSRRIKITVEYKEDANFEKWLTNQKFPDSYKPKLRELHMLYPNWEFHADITGIDFATAVNNEYAGDGKFVGASVDDSKKCMEEGFYDFSTGKYKGTEGSAWVKASRATLEYYMDPRNFFDTSSIFMFLTQSYTPGTATVEQVKNVAKGTFMDSTLPDNPKKTYAQVILEAAETYKMNPFVIVGLIRQEQGTKGTSSLISGTVKGYENLYNYFNVGAYDDGKMSAATRGLWWAKGASNGATSYLRPWNTREKAIKGGVMFTVNGYISEGQDTYYYMNFNVMPNDSKKRYTHQYAGNVEDSLGKGKSMSSAYFDITEKVIFNIPVYKNMPEKTALAPSGSNNDCYLKNLSVTNYQIASFGRYKNEYELIVPYSQKSIEIIAEKSNAKSTVSGAGTVNLNVGANEISITVTSSSGLKNVYKLSVYREPGSEEPTPKPTLKTSYKTDTFITGVSPETAIKGFVNNLGVKDGKVKIIGKNGAEKTTGNISTNDSVYIYDLNGKEFAKYKVIIYGDANCDGKITSVDMLSIQKNIFGITTFSDAQTEAADVNHDSKIKSTDMLSIQKYLFGIKTIIQVR